MAEQRIVIVGQRGMTLARDLLALGHVVQHVPSCRRLSAGLPAGTWDACVLVVDQLTVHDANLIRHARAAQPELAVLLFSADEASARSLARLTGADDIVVPSHPRTTVRRIMDCIARRRARLRDSNTPPPAPVETPPTPAIQGAIAQRDAAQLAERVTHEIDNPATYVTANLTSVNDAIAALARDLRHDVELSQRLDELEQMVRESLNGMARISSITRDLRTAVLVERFDDPDGWAASPSAGPKNQGARSPASSQLRPRVDPGAALPSPSAAPPGRLRLLLIDDEPLVLRALRRMLAKHSVVVANGGADALSKLTSRSDYDLVLCDLMMPEMDGTEVHAAIMRRFPHLLERFVLFTGGALTSRTRAFIEQSSQLLIHKPVTLASFSELAEHVRSRAQAPRAKENA